jgi:hypothetical protein
VTASQPILGSQRCARVVTTRRFWRTLVSSQSSPVLGKEPALIWSLGRTSRINYGERFRAGERISSCLAESTVNAVISKRFAKRQQMQWTKRGAHLLLQTRTRTLDGTLRPLFERWHPGLANDNAAGAAQAVAA